MNEHPSAKAWQGFSDSATLLEREAKLIHTKYVNKWIGIYAGEVQASGESFEDVIAALGQKKIPVTESLVRFIGQEEPTLIL